MSYPRIVRYCDKELFRVAADDQITIEEGVTAEELAEVILEAMHNIERLQESLASCHQSSIELLSAVVMR